MKICFVIDDYSAIGGIQRVAALMANELTKVNEVSVLSLYREHGDTNRDLYDAKVKLSVLISGPKKYVQQSLKAVALIRSYLKKNDVDIVIGTSEMMSPYIYLATVFTSIPYICWTHTPALNNEEALLQSLFKKLGVKTSKYTVTLSEESRIELIKKYGVDHVTVITNPIDPKLMVDIDYDGESKKIVTVGRVCYQKYYEKLVEVAAIVLHECSDWRWDIYGDGNDMDKISELINEAGLNGYVCLKGDVTNMYEFYKDYAFQVITSRFEGFPMTLLEGVANGLPLIGFDISGVNDIIKDGINGYLVTPYDASKMAESIARLIADSELRKKMSDYNKNNRDIYSIEKTANRWNQLFAEIRNK